jgi:hypothetical protein
MKEMMMSKKRLLTGEVLNDIFRKCYPALGILAAAGLIGYGLSYIIVMPEISPDGFVPKILDRSTGTSPWFGTILAAFVLLYAFTFLPVAIMFTIKKYKTMPYALVFSCCLISLSSVIEIINNLPLVAAGIYPGKLESISSDLLLHLRQVEAIRYLSYDVAGFSLIYVAIFVYAVVYFRSHRLFSYTILGSIFLFVANVPFLWFAPKVSVILMAFSIFACALVPIFLSRMTTE